MRLLCKKINAPLSFWLWVATFHGLSVFAAAEQPVKSDQAVVSLVDQTISQDSQAEEVILVANLAIQEGWHINSNKPLNDFLIPTSIQADKCPGFQVNEIVFPAHKIVKLAFSNESLALFAEKLSVAIQGRKIQVRKAAPCVFGFRYQACNDTVCLGLQDLEIRFKLINAVIPQSQAGGANGEPPPRAVNPSTSLRVDEHGGGDYSQIAPETKSTKRTFNSHSEPKRAPDIQGSDPLSGKNSADTPGNSVVQKYQNLKSEGNILWAFFLIFLAGLGLNLTPCVYPLIPITIGVLGGSAAQKNISNIKKMFRAGLYAAGICGVYAVMGYVAAVTGSVLGAFLQHPAVLILLAVMIGLFAASMFGAFQLVLPTQWLSRFSQGSNLGVLLMGATAGIIAAPCIGPVIGALLIFVAQLADPREGFLLFFVLSLGLSLPYFFLGIFSPLLDRLPKSGNWMVLVKKGFGFLLVGVALFILLPFFGWAVFKQSVWWLALLALTYFSFFERGLANSRILLPLRALLLIIAVLIVSQLFSQSEKIDLDKDFISYRAGLLEEAQNKGQPVLIDFYADWCIPCQELSLKTFPNEAVREALKNFVKIKVDLTFGGTDIEDELRRKFNVTGFPTVILMGRDGKELRHLRVLGFIPPEEMVVHLREVK